MKDEFLASNEIKKTSYYYNDNNKKLVSIDKLKKSKFDESGRNLTICILSLNRVKLTIKLLSSIEYYLEQFIGKILIVDNGSAKSQLLELKAYIHTSDLNVTIHELNENHGVGRARNIAAEIIDTEWIMFIDNDMYFVKNPLKLIQNTILGLGCKFLNLPLINYDNKTVFALGGALYPYVWDDGSFIGAGSCFDFKRSVETNDVIIDQPFLSDFLFGGASIVERKAFLDYGGFDYNMFVGFEDIDFSLRLYNEGQKIGNIPDFTLIHNHKPSDNIDDIKAEKERFNSQVIKDSANAFLKKNGLPVYDKGTEEWLRLRESQLNIDVSNTLNGVRNDVKSKPKIALVADIKGWAFDNIAINIKNNLSSKYDFDIYYHTDYDGERWLDIFYMLYKEKYDIVFVFWRPIIKQLFSRDLSVYLHYKFGISSEDFKSYLNSTVIITGVYDHLFLEDSEIKDFEEVYRNNVDGYFVASNMLKTIYENISTYPKPYAVIQDGVSLETFYKKKNKRFTDINEPLKVGWAGNSKWGWGDDGIDHKGFITIIKPAIAELQKEGYLIDLHYADKQDPSSHILPSCMNEFYNKLDVYICASSIEGTPNPILESMACGIGVITTNVGIVSEVFGIKQKQFILRNRTKEELKDKIKRLLLNRTILYELSEENQVRIRYWTWESKCERFDEMFEYYLFKLKSKNNILKEFPYPKMELSNLPPNDINSFHSDLSSSLDETDGHDYSVQIDQLIKMNNLLSEQYNDMINKFSFYEDNFYEVKKWYHKEYEVLPKWYKKMGHIVKVFQGNRSLKSLFNKKNH